MSLPTISVILVSWNRRDLLRGAIQSIADHESWPHEVIVVDNGSTDGTSEMLRAGCWPGPLMVYASPSNLNASEGRNVGIRMATGELVLFMDSDAEITERDTLRRLAAPFAADPQLGGLVPFIYRDRDRRQPWFLNGRTLRGWYCDPAGIVTPSSEPPEFLTSCFALYRREAVIRAGGFDLGLPYGHEDHDLSLRVRAAGYALAMAPECAVRHHFTPVSRILGESDRWAHHYVDERARNRIQLRRFGLAGYLREEAWLWSSDGREQRRQIYAQTGLSRPRRAALFVLLPLTALLSYPWNAWQTRCAGWLKDTVYKPSRVRIIPPQQSGAVKS